MSNNKSHNIEFLVYIAGVLVPAKNVSIQTAFNSLPMATIALPADVRLYAIGRQDRVPVHIFIKDTLAGSNNYILMFEGEVKSFGFTSSVVSREVTVNAQSNLAFLMDIKAFFMHSIGSIADLEVLDHTANAGFFKMEALTFPHSLFMRGITNLDSDGEIIKYPSEFLQNLYRFIQEEGSIPGYNTSALAKFYSKYTEALSLKNKMVKVPVFDDGDKWENGFPLLAGMQKVTALEQLVSRGNTGASNRGKTGDTIYNWLNYIVSEMLYEMAFIAAPTLGTNMNGEISLGSSMLKPMMYESPPPECNIMCRSHVDDLRTSEDVYQVPTRIIVDNSRGIIGKLIAHSQESTISDAATTYFYPNSNGASSPISMEDEKNRFSAELLGEEMFTGPYLYETKPPAWADYIDNHQDTENTRGVLMDRIMSYLLQLKQYERRSLSVSGAFNPFVVPGFSGVAFDSTESDFVFCGYVMAVNHTISKNSCRTSVNMGFVRLLDEAINDPLINPAEDVNEITTNVSSCSDIYEGIIGTSAVGFSEVRDVASLGNIEAGEAYKLNSRNIVTMREYFQLMGITIEEADYLDTGYGEEIPAVLNGPLMDTRRNSTLRDTLKDILFESLENKVY